MLTDRQKAVAFRDKYYGRQDVVAGHFEKVSDDGKVEKGCYPLTTWPAKNPVEYLPVSDDLVLQHIRGDRPLSFYVLQKDSTIKFGALDFDCKPGKETEGYTFDDVKKIFPLLKQWNIAFRVARSTTNGFHVLFFLRDFYPANKFRAVMEELFHHAGYTAALRSSGKIPPEIFPKQIQVRPDKFGNCIKAEMIEARFIDQRNGFVTEENTWIGAGLRKEAACNAQWEHLTSSQLVESATLDQVIERYASPVAPVIPYKERSRQSIGSPAKGEARAPLETARGSAEKLLDGCEALRALRDRCLAGQQPNHDEGIGLFTLLMHTTDGVEWFKKNVPGWAKTEDDWKELDHLLESRYLPWSCQTMRAKHLCVKMTECFDSNPPNKKNDQGRWVPDLSVPEIEWPKPSPIRYAHLTQDDLKKKLEADMEALKAITDQEARQAALHKVALDAQDLDPPQFADLKKKLRTLKDDSGNKVLAGKEVTHVFEKAAEEKTKEALEEYRQSPDRLTINANTYLRAAGHGYIHSEFVKGQEKLTKICSVDIDIEEVRSYVDDGFVIEKVYVGQCISEGVCEPFEINTDMWEDNIEFKKKFAKLLGGHFNVLRQDIDLIRQASLGFSMEEKFLESRSLMTQGWVKDTYMMPSVIVNKEGVSPNTAMSVNLESKGHASRIDWQVSTADELKDVLRHIRDELLVCWPRYWTTTSIGHAMLPVLAKKLDINNRPTFFMAGESGAGKTQLQHLMQYFYGDFPKLLNATTSSKSVLSNLYDFKDALLVLDDFKGITPGQIADIKNVIQYSYDGNESGKLNRDGTHRRGKEARGVLMASGEHFVTSEASVVARTILIEVERHDTRETTETFRRCKAMRKKYSMVTPHFLASVLKWDTEALGQRFTALQVELVGLIAGRQNAPRVAFNLALNHLSWSLFTEFLGEQGVITPIGVKDYIDEHRLYIEGLVKEMADRCEEEQGVSVFMRVLKQQVAAGEVSIKGWQPYDHQNRVNVGFEYDGNTIAFYPDITFAQVMHGAKHSPITGTVRSIAQQLQAGNYLVLTQKNRLTRQVRIGGKQDRVWLMSKAHFTDEEQSPPGQTLSLAEHKEKMLIKTAVRKATDEGGII